MGVSVVDAASMLRFSFSRFNSIEDVDTAADALIRSVKKLRVLNDELRVQWPSHNVWNR